MTCVRYQEMMSRFVDHELEGAETAEVFAHVGTCSRCQEFFHGVLKLRVAIVQERDAQYVPAPVYQSNKKKPLFFESMIALHNRIRLRDRQITLSLPVAAAITSLLIGISVAATMFSIGHSQPQQQALVVQPREVILLTLPAVEVHGYYSSTEK